MSDTQTTEEVKASYVNEDGTWNVGAFGDGLGEHSIFEKFKTPEETIKGTINAQELIGKKAQDFWTSEDPDHVSMRNGIMGIPAEASEYEWETPEAFMSLPEELQKEVEKDVQDSAAFALENGIGKSAFKALIERGINRTINNYNENVKNGEISVFEGQEELKKEWGMKHDYNYAKTEDTLTLLEMPLLAQYAESDPALVREIFEKLTPNFADDKLTEARQEQSMATLEDKYRDITNRMRNFKGDTRGSEYELLRKENEKILMKMTGAS